MVGDTRSSLAIWAALLIAMTCGCSRQQSDWKSARTVNTVESYQQFLKNYPAGEFTAQAKARVNELSQERDWQKARDLDTADAYQAFLKQYPEGKWTDEARIRIENFSLAQAPSDEGSTGAAESGMAVSGAATAAPMTAATAAPGVEADADSPPNNATSASVEDEPSPSASSAPKANVSRKTHASTPNASVTSKGTAKSSSGGGYAVQLGAFGAGAAAAERSWASLQKAQPQLRGLGHRVVSGSGGLYKLQAVNLTQRHAESLCSELKAKSQSCMVIRP